MIGVLHHPKIPRSRPLADEVVAWLTDQQQSVWRASVWDEATLASNIKGTTLLIALGGDGSILRAARVAATESVPVCSINLGRLGFLSMATPTNWREMIGAVLANEHRLETRLMLQAVVTRGTKVLGEMIALNEVVVGRGRQARVLHFELEIDGKPVTEYVADGLITATPTGSTAYALAAGGPILPPELPNFLVVPVAPHLSLDRAIVLHQETVVRLIVYFDHEATVTVDGQEALDLQSGDVVTISKAPHPSLFARVQDASYFYQRLTRPGSGLNRD